MKPEKIKLMEEVDKYKKAIKSSVDKAKTFLEGKGRHIAIVGGAIVVGAIVYRLFRGSRPEVVSSSDDSSKKVVVVGSSEPFIVRIIKEHIALFLLSIAKEKLMQFIKDRQEAAAREKETYDDAKVVEK